jgi:MoxR-like ATPase
MKIGPGEPIPLAPQGGIADQVHLFEATDISAINGALAAGRPLLVRGEPGVGKSQLARAAARALKRAFVPFVVDSQTESRDLLWRFDAVARLAEAQLAGALRIEAGAGGEIVDREKAIRELLAVRNFVSPGPLWWGFDWERAEAQAVIAGSDLPDRRTEGDLWRNGCVVLIDEIDKAEAEVPNGLLEALGAGEFTPPGGIEPVKVGHRRPLVVITSNEERMLPAAFIRRCLVHRLELPEAPERLKARLIEVGRAHFPEPSVTEAVLESAAAMLVEDRTQAKGARPGQAEYLDLLRAVATLHPHDPDNQLSALERIRGFTLGKHAPRRDS